MTIFQCFGVGDVWEGESRYVNCTLSRWLVPLFFSLYCVYTMKHLHRSRTAGERTGERTDEPTLQWGWQRGMETGESERGKQGKRMAIVGAIYTFCSGNQRRLGAQFFIFQQLL